MYLKHTIPHSLPHCLPSSSHCFINKGFYTSFCSVPLSASTTKTAPYVPIVPARPSRTLPLSKLLLPSRICGNNPIPCFRASPCRSVTQSSMWLRVLCAWGLYWECGGLAWMLAGLTVGSYYSLITIILIKFMVDQRPPA